VPVAVARERLRADRSSRPARVANDTTLVVKPGSKFELHSFGGQVAIATWPRNAVRIQVEHAKKDYAQLTHVPGLLRVASVSPNGPAQAFEYRLTVPACRGQRAGAQFRSRHADERPHTRIIGRK
jgi:hypothetical protein